MKELLRKEYFLVLLPVTVSVCMLLMAFFGGYKLDLQILSSSIISVLLLLVLLNTSKEQRRQRFSLLGMCLVFGTLLMGFTLVLSAFINSKELNFIDTVILSVLLPLGSLLNLNEMSKRFKGEFIKPTVGYVLTGYILTTLALFAFKLYDTGEGLINEAGVMEFNINASILYAISLFSLSRISARNINA